MIKYLYLFAALISLSLVGHAQCPVMNAALIDACGVGADEGYNEFLVVKTGTVPLALTDFNIQYSTSATFASSVLNIDGSTAGIWTTKTGAGVITNSAGILTTTTTGPLPANTPVVIMPRNVSTNYDLSSFGPNVVVLYFDISKVTSGWAQSGNLANQGPSANRYFRLTSTGGTCTSTVSYDRANLPNGSGGDGVVWNPSTGAASYVNSGCTTPLPLNLLAFSGNIYASALHLEWSAACESSVQDYIIEKSTGTEFHTVVSLPALNKGCGEESAYSYTDAIFGSGQQLYRLKMRGFDGRVTYSNTLRFDKTGQQTTEIHILENPARDYLRITAGSAAATDYRILDISGRIVLRGTTGSDAEEQQIPIQSLQSGFYIVHISGQPPLKFMKR